MAKLLCISGALDMGDTAVAMIVFNRPELTRRVLAAVAQARPTKLFVIADAARAVRPGEEARVAEVRALFDEIDWPCTVHRNFSDTNNGCKRRIISGIDWLFENVDSAIILEDDCLPVPKFFDYCEEMLSTYRDDPRVFSISGSNFLDTIEPAGHYFSQTPANWGWATWRDRWAHYVGDPDDVAAVVSRTWRRQPMKWAYWRKIFSMLATGKFDAWDYQWMLTHWRHNAMCVKPTQNLVENIGFGSDATHTADTSSWLARLPVYDGNESFTQAPAAVVPDRERDAVEAVRLTQISLKTLIAMYLPIVPKIARKIRN